MNDITEAMWWDLIDTARMTTEDWTSDWCKDSCCIKWQWNEVKIHSKWLMQISWHHTAVHSALHVNSEWCCWKSHSNHEKLSVYHD